MSAASPSPTDRHAPASGSPRVANLSLLLSQTAALFPERPGLIHGEHRWSWAQIDARVDALVQGLRALGMQPGERLLVLSRNGIALFESCWAAFRLGAVWVPVNFRLTAPEVAALGSASGATVMLAEEMFASQVDAVRAASPGLRHMITIGRPRADRGEHGYEALLADNAAAAPSVAPVHADTPLWFFYTSGTTGRPKAAMLTHGQMAFVVANHLADLIPGTDERDCSIAVAPLSHGAGIHALLNVARGAATVLPTSDRLEPAQVWELVQRHRVTNLFAVPTIVKRLVEDPAVDRFDHGTLRYVVYAGAPMYHADQQRALRTLGPVLVQYFGLGEVTGCITVLPPAMHRLDAGDGGDAGHAGAGDALIGTCGRARTGMEVAVLDADLRPVPTGHIGEICCRGPAVFTGYHDNPEATAQALRGGWFHTGDLGRLDARGLLYITGRESDMYISGGSNVYPREVEELLLTHPAVAEVAVLGMPDAAWGEIGVAVVVAREAGEGGEGAAGSLTAQDLLAYLDGRCARYRWPRQFHFWEALPRSGYGKVAKKDIRERLLATAPQGKEPAAPAA